MAALVGLALLGAPVAAQDVAEDSAPDEADHYRIVDIPVPDDVFLEVSGLLDHSDGRLYVCTRRGDLWAVEDPYGEAPQWSLWADGLAEPLGLLEDDDGSLLVVQRAELSRLADADGDGRADIYGTLTDDWPTSGDYHEYAFGPARDPDGHLWITLNRPFGAQHFGSVDWRGWAMRLNPEGELERVSAGLRSPAGVGTAPWGDVFYTDNQGEWCGASKLSHLQPGRFYGHPWGMESCKLPDSQVAYPGPLPDGALMPLANRVVPGFALPAVWFPYDVMGRSPSGFAWDLSDGAFGPFSGQLFVGDQYQSSVLRVDLEQVDGTWQGACFPFRKGFDSGLIRVVFGSDDSLVVGGSNRGWPSLGTEDFCLQRLVYTGELPFEMESISVRPDGFVVRFTLPVDPDTATALASWECERFTYRLHSPYGSDETDTWPLPVTAAELSADRLAVTLTVDGMREGYVHALTAEGLTAHDGRPLLHDQAFYTLMDLPGEAPVERAVVLIDGQSAVVGPAGERLDVTLRGALEADGWAVTIADPHRDAQATGALRDASLVVLLTGDLPADAPGTEALLRYLDGGHGLVAVGAGLRPLMHGLADGSIEEVEDPWLDDEALEAAEAEGGLAWDPALAAPWCVERLVGGVIGAAAHAGAATTVTRALRDDEPEGDEHPALAGRDLTALPAGPLTLLADDPDSEPLLLDDAGRPVLWTRDGERQRIVGASVTPDAGLLAALARWAARIGEDAAPTDDG